MGQRLTLTKILQVRNLAQQGYRTREIARNLGVCVSLVYRIRQGRYRVCEPSEDDRPRQRAVRCPRCRCRVFPPCVACGARAAAARLAARPKAPRPDLANFDPAHHDPAHHDPAHHDPAHHDPAHDDPEMRDRLATNVAELALSLRVINVLQRAGIETVADLLQCRPEQLCSLPSFGHRVLATVFAALAQIGFQREGAVACAPPHDR
ncbi:MAG: hypothetical protein HYS13_20550 [Planctomycetia bacterium]|nr:hypothetical protein [Planctomycetia bacterium]